MRLERVLYSFPTFVVHTLRYSYGSKFLKFKILNGGIPKGSKFPMVQNS